MPKHTHETLSKMTVPSIRQLVRDHNMHVNLIRRYSKMKKADLITNFLKHQGTPGTRKRSGTKPKLTDADKAFGLGKPLYKEGVVEGARKQFEARYGSTADAKFLRLQQKIWEKEEDEKLGRGKRHKKKPKKLQD
jgi:hypothetical protein